MKVLECDNEKVRYAVESFTMQYTYPDVIKFIYDSTKQTYITSTENLDNPKFVKITGELKEKFLLKNVDTKDCKNLKEVLSFFTNEADFKIESSLLREEDV